MQQKLSFNLVIFNAYICIGHNNTYNINNNNNIKTKIDKKQLNSKCKLCGDWDETINHIISECSKLAQTGYKTSHDWAGKVIHWELCKKWKLDHTTKWYMHKPKSVPENEKYKILLDFKIQTEHPVPTRGPD